jgi:hypothetical protein
MNVYLTGHIQNVFYQLNSEETLKSDFAFLTTFLMRDCQEELLQNPSEYEQIIQRIEQLNFACLPDHQIKSYLTQKEDLVINFEYALRVTPRTLKIFLKVVFQILKQEALPLTLLHGKSFFYHLKYFARLLPAENEISVYLNRLQSSSITLFEELLIEKIKIDLMLDVEEKMIRLTRLKERSGTLLIQKFPGISRFIEEIQENIEKGKTNISESEQIYEILTASASQAEKIGVLKKLCENYSKRRMLLGYLLRRENFESLSLYLEGLSYTDWWAYNVFKEICLEKAQNIAQGRFALKPSDTSEWLAVAWNQYYLSACIYRDSSIFTPEQSKIIDELIKEDVIKCLARYMQTSYEDDNEHHEYGTTNSLEPSIPLSLDLVKHQKKVLFPVLLPSHVVGLLVECEEVAIYNTGDGIKANHPKTADGLKYQTCLRMTMPDQNLFKEDFWREIRKLKMGGNPDQLYALFSRWGCKPISISDHPLDFEFPQLTGTCLFQHMQALARDMFMRCEKLGTKEMRFAAYRIVASDFMNFIGKTRFPIEKRHDLLQQKQNLEEVELLETWLEKEQKLHAILNLAKSFDRNKSEGNHLEYLSRQFISSKSAELSLEKDAKALREVRLIYWKSQHQRALEVIKKTPLDKLPKKAARIYKYSKFKEETAKFILECVSGEPELMQAFKKKLEE